MKKIITRLLVLALILFFTCEIGLRIRLAYLYKNPDWLLYHQFKLRTAEEINTSDLPHYYIGNMFKPFNLVFRSASPKSPKEIITIESSALRSIRRQMQILLENNPDLKWIDYSPDKDKNIDFTNNNIVLYEFLVYPDIYNTLKRESRILKKIFGATMDDFLYHNFAFYMHIDENINFTSMNSDKVLEDYLKLLVSREEPFCKSINEFGYNNVFYVITPNGFDPNSPGGKIYLKYINSAYKEMLKLLDKYKVPCIDLMNEKVEKSDFNDFFHFSKVGGRKMSELIIEYLSKRGY